MPYSPGVQFDPSPLYRGLSNLGEGLAAGIAAKRKKEEEKKKKEEALKFARQIMPSLNPDMANADDKTLAAGIEAVGIDNVLNLASNITQAAQQKQAADLKRQEIEQEIEQRRQEMAAAERNRAALSAAADPNAGLAEQILSGARFGQLDPRQQANPGMTYLRRGGDDPRHLNELNDLAAGMAKGGRAGPQLMDLGGGVRGVWDGNNFSRVPDPKAEKDVAPTANIGGRRLTSFGGKIFDESGAVVAPDKPLDPITGQMLLTSYQATIAKIEGHKEGMPWERKAKSRELVALQEKANFQADQLGFQQPFPGVGTAPERAEKAAVKKGTRVKQGGVVYEYDGKDYKPVK